MERSELCRNILTIFSSGANSLIGHITGKFCVMQGDTTMDNLAVSKALSYLCRIVEAGEKGYAVSAANVSNQGLKLLLKSHAQQRSRFKSEILAEIRRLDSNLNPRNSIRGVLHRGRINIFSALAAGNDEKEKIVLKEIMVGEKIALKAYETALKKDLPRETQGLISRQYAEVKK